MYMNAHSSVSYMVLYVVCVSCIVLYVVCVCTCVYVCARACARVCESVCACVCACMCACVEYVNETAHLRYSGSEASVRMRRASLPRGAISPEAGETFTAIAAAVCECM